jgi:hypothetical protein
LWKRASIGASKRRADRVFEKSMYPVTLGNAGMRFEIFNAGFQNRPSPKAPPPKKFNFLLRTRRARAEIRALRPVSVHEVGRHLNRPITEAHDHESGALAIRLESEEAGAENNRHRQGKNAF